MPALVAASFSGVVSLTAQGSSALGGRWALNRQQSEFPAEVGFGLDLAPVGGGASGSPGRSGGRGRRGSTGPAAANPWLSGLESPDDAKRQQQLTAEVRRPPSYLLISDSPTAVSISDDRGQMRTLHPAAKEDVIQLDGVPVAVVTKREGDAALVVRYNVEQGRELRYTYFVTPTPRQLIVEVRFVERGGGDVVRRVYDALGPDDPLPAPTSPEPPRSTRFAAPPASAPAAPAPDRLPAGQPATAPPAVQTPDAELKGLSRLGIVVEEMSSQAAACGLSREAVETAVTQPLTDVGLKVVRNSDDDTYLYVNVITTRLPTGYCVSRYDASLYSHTTATLSFQQAPVLVQVALLHSGGISGGAPAAHAESVVGTLKQYVAQFATRIRSVR